MDAVRRLGSEGVDCGITLVESSTGITIDKGGIAAHDGMTIPRKRVNRAGTAVLRHIRQQDE